MKILFAYAPGWTDEMFAAFRALGLEPVLLPGPEQQPYSMDFSDIEMVVCYRFFCCNEISRFPSLKYIHTTSSGTDHMPLDYIRSHGIHMDNARGVYSIPMAEYALGAVLQLYKDALPLRAMQAAHRWQPRFETRELGGKQLAILGTGSVAAECALRFSAMGCRCVGFSRHPAENVPGFAEQRHISCLDDFLPETDILLLALPLTPETRGIVDARRLARIKPGAVLVNVARGPVVDTSALADALHQGILSGAACDVFETEPLPADSPLWETENLILTPHCSFAGEGNPRRLFALCYKDITAWLNTEGRNL